MYVLCIILQLMRRCMYYSSANETLYKSVQEFQGIQGNVKSLYFQFNDLSLPHQPDWIIQRFDSNLSAFLMFEKTHA